jgi:protein phosphatase
MYTFDYAQKTDVGKLRTQNQDAMGISQTPSGLLFVTCDGMGGHQAGDTAAKMAVQGLGEFFATKKFSNAEIPIAFMDACHLVDEKIVIHSINNLECAGMGTTAVMLLINQEQGFYAHIGDSRLYHLKNDTLTLLTKDHSYVQKLVDLNKITEQEAQFHPKKNLIERALGAQDCTPDVDTISTLNQGEDLFLLCSDGLTNMLSETDIYAVLSSNDFDLTKKATLLVAMANEGGGTDNITVQLVRRTKI